MSTNPEAQVRSLRRALVAVGNPVRAAQEKRYLKSTLRHFGTGVPAVRATARDFTRDHPLDREALKALAEALFDTGVFEMRSVAIAILERARKQLEPADADWLIGLVRASPLWAHVDWLAAAVVGPVLGDSPRARRQLDKWARDPDVWVRRTAILAPLVPLRSGGGDFEAFEARVTPLLADESFWTRKAIGWVLREVSRRRPELTAGFVTRHHAALSALTWREATRRLPEALRAALPARALSSSRSAAAGVRRRRSPAPRG